MNDGTKCAHGYFAHLHCPWCCGLDGAAQDLVPVVGHGNGWLLRRGEPVCESCGGPAEAGWGGTVVVDGPRMPPKLCYSCRIGSNTKEAIAKREEHEARRGVRKVRGGKS